jgi:hypothetical protein
MMRFGLCGLVLTVVFQACGGDSTPAERSQDGRSETTSSGARSPSSGATTDHMTAPKPKPTPPEPATPPTDLPSTTVTTPGGAIYAEPLPPKRASRPPTAGCARRKARGQIFVVPPAPGASVRRKGRSAVEVTYEFAGDLSACKPVRLSLAVTQVGDGAGAQTTFTSVRELTGRVTVPFEALPDPDTITLTAFNAKRWASPDARLAIPTK